MRRSLEFESILNEARTLAPDDLPEFLGALETVRVTALARLSSPVMERPDELLSVPEAAARLSVSPNYLYRNSRRFPFSRRIGKRLLFSSVGIDAFLRKEFPPRPGMSGRGRSRREPKIKFVAVELDSAPVGARSRPARA